MQNKILITYATVHGSTREISEYMRNALARDDRVVDLIAASKVKMLAEYSGVILGAPQYMFHWHKDALKFLSRNRKAIENGLPVAIFAGGPIEKNSDEELTLIRSKLEAELGALAWFKPVSLHFVGGKFDPLALHFPYSLIPALKQQPAADFRDWADIQAWAVSLPDLFESISKQAAA